MFDIIKVITDIALTAADLKSLELNNSHEARTIEEKQERAKQRKLISNVRNVSYIVKRIAR